MAPARGNAATLQPAIEKARSFAPAVRLVEPPAVTPVEPPAVTVVEPRRPTTRPSAAPLVRARVARPAGCAERPRTRAPSNTDRWPADTLPSPALGIPGPPPRDSASAPCPRSAF